MTEWTTLRFGRPEAVTGAGGATGKLGSGGSTAGVIWLRSGAVAAVEVEAFGAGTDNDDDDKSGSAKMASASYPNVGASNTEGSIANPSLDPDRTGAVVKSKSASETGLRSCKPPFRPDEEVDERWSSDSGEKGEPGIVDGMKVEGSKEGSSEAAAVKPWPLDGAVVDDDEGGSLATSGAR